jgi:hypothetical protein
MTTNPEKERYLIYLPLTTGSRRALKTLPRYTRGLGIHASIS